MSKAFQSFRAFILVLFVFSAEMVFAQSSDISPYSRFGIGDLQDQSSALNFSMGGTGIAYHNDAGTPFFINLKNPASYAYGFIPIADSTGKNGIKMVTFEGGLEDNILRLSTEGQTANSNNAYLSYLVINMPVSRHVGLALGLIPVSTEGYNISTNSTIDSNNRPGYPLTTVQNIYQGSGGINKVFIGAAYAPFKNLSIGGNFSYLFGTLTNQEEIEFPPNISALGTLKQESTTLHSFYADFGIMYTFKISDWSATLGATVTPSLYVNAGYSILTVSQFLSGGSIISNIDTLQDSSTNGKIRMPLMVGYGITVKKGDHWTFSVDYSFQNWSQYTYFGQPEDLTDSWSYGVGIQYVPNKDYPKEYGQRIHYRMGFSYGQSYLDLYNTPLIQKSISAGVGLPIGSSNPFNHPAVLNIGLRLGSMGTTTNNLILQDYFQVVVGITFDDHWFDKRMFE